MKNKKGMSEIITTVIMIALVMAAAGIIWEVVNNLIQKNTQQTESCFGLYEKVNLYGQGVCYDSENQRVSVYVEVKDVDIDKIIVSIYTEAETKSFEVPGENLDVAIYTKNSPEYGTNLSKLTQNSGKRFWVRNINSIPTSISISPIINGNQCEISDTIKTIEYCDS
jgi:flagellin-like protein